MLAQIPGLHGRRGRGIQREQPERFSARVALPWVRPGCLQGNKALGNSEDGAHTQVPFGRGFTQAGLGSGRG